MINPEQLRQIADVMERNPDGWWREFELRLKDTYKWESFEFQTDVWTSIQLGYEIRLNRIPIHGWVDAELIDRARNAYGDPDYEPITADLAKALLDCVEKNDE